MTKYNDTFTMIVCSAAHLKNSYDELLAAVMHLGCFSCHATRYRVLAWNFRYFASSKNFFRNLARNYFFIVIFASCRMTEIPVDCFI